VKSEFKAHAFILAANILYGIHYSIGKIALASLDPFAIVTIRVFTCMILFWLVHKIFINESVEKKDHLKLIISAIFGVAINQLLFFKGLSLTSEMHSAIIMITTPILVLIFGWLLLKSSISWVHVLGVITGGIGVAFLILSGSTEDNSRASALGDLMIMINASSFAFFLVITKPLMKKYSPLTITKWIFIYGFPLVLPFGIGKIMETNWQEIQPVALLSLVYVVLGATFFAYLFNVLGLKFGNATLVRVYIYTQPVIAFLISYFSGMDTINIQKIISAVLVFSGVAMVSFTGKKSNPVEST